MSTLDTAEQDRSSRTAAEWLWPLLPIGASVFCGSALVYYHLHQELVAPRSTLQVLIAGIYRTMGLAPSMLFCLLALTWSSIWFVTGRLERPLVRISRLAAMAIMLGVFLNLGDGGVTAAVHKGTLGAWLASTLVSAFGYFPSIILVWAVTFASLLLATDFFFSDSFERLRTRAAPTELGVETAVTDHLRGLGTVMTEVVGGGVGAGGQASSAAVDSRGHSDLAFGGAAARATPPFDDPLDSLLDTGGDTKTDAAAAAAGMLDGPRAGDAAAQSGAESDTESDTSDTESDTEFGGLPADSRRASYFERRREQLEEDWVPMGPDSQEIDNPETVAADAEVPPAEAIAEDAEVVLPIGEADRAEPTGTGWIDLSGSGAPTDAPSAAADTDATTDAAATIDGQPTPSPDGSPAAEPIVSIPRPAGGPRVRPVTPPAQKESAPKDPLPKPVPRDEAKAARQRGLFASGVDDGLVAEAVDLLTGTRRVSASLLQRRLRIDYDQAMELMVELAARGFVELEADASQGRVRV